MYALPPVPPPGGGAHPRRAAASPASASFTTYVDTIKYTTHTYTVHATPGRGSSKFGAGADWAPAPLIYASAYSGIGVAACRVSVHAPRHERQHRRRARRLLRLRLRLRHRRRQRAFQWYTEMPISHLLVRPRRRAAERTNAAIDASVRELAGVSRLGIVKKKRNK